VYPKLGPIIGIITAIVISAASCQPTTAKKADDASDNQISQYRIPITQALQPFYEQEIDWFACGADPSECGYVTVPLDWTKPGDDTIQIALFKHPASEERLGSILVNAGGPGVSGVELVAAGVEYAVDAALSAQFDIIGFDPRGVGQSTAVDCGGSAGLDKFLYDTVPGEIGGKSWIAAQKAKALVFAKACEEGSGELLGHIDTVTAARDMDIIRAALGEEKLNYLGYSYGTELGVIYAGLHPERVGHFVFDGPDNPWFGYDDIVDDQAGGFENSLDQFLRDCLDGDVETVGTLACPFTGDLDDAEGEVIELFDAVSRDPIDYVDGRELNGQTLATGISEALYDPTSWPQLTELFAETLHGDPTEAFALADEYNYRDSDGTYFDNSNEAFIAIGCLEYGPSVDLRYDARELAALKEQDPMLGPYQGYADLTCSGWSYGPTDFPDAIDASGAPPMLLIATTGDPATPYPAAKALAKQLSSGVLVTFNGDSHTAYALGNVCVDDVVNNFFINGTVPDSDPQCH
jgi:pimeloyl-ACP methyl ester carboxylesterase